MEHRARAAIVFVHELDGEGNDVGYHEVSEAIGAHVEKVVARQVEAAPHGSEISLEERAGAGHDVREQRAVRAVIHVDGAPGFVGEAVGARARGVDEVFEPQAEIGTAARMIAAVHPVFDGEREDRIEQRVRSLVPLDAYVGGEEGDRGEATRLPLCQRSRRRAIEQRFVIEAAGIAASVGIGRHPLRVVEIVIGAPHVIKRFERGAPLCRLHRALEDIEPG